MNKALSIPCFDGTLIGRSITKIRALRPEELSGFCWGSGERAVVVELDNGEDFLVLSQDPEGNGPGAAFSKNSIIC